ncbi:hypothetical protein Gotur_030960 [Gossypium turneri]
MGLLGFHDIISAADQDFILNGLAGFSTAVPLLEDEFSVWHCGDWTERIKSCTKESEMNRFSFIRIQHINRSKNQLAYLLAKECLSSGEVSYLEDDVPSHARQTMENEWAREPD